MEYLPVDESLVPLDPETIEYFNEFSEQIDFGYLGEPTEFFLHSHLPVMPIQMLTPPTDGSAEKARVVSVSSSFFPGSHKSISDTIFRSSDAVLFYVNAKVLLKASRAIFQELLGASLNDKRFRDVIVDVPESSSILDIIIHTIYGLSCAKHSPPFDDLETAVNRMPVYGLAPKVYIVPGSPLFEVLLSHAPVHPIRLYALAGHFGIQELAVNTSSHLLSYDLANLTDDLAKRMGATYLKRLMCLHISLLDSLKTTIMQPPYPHPATSTCNFVEQKKFSRAWALAASSLAWDFRPDLPIQSIQSTLSALGDHIVCDQCKVVLKSRVKEIVIKWASVKRTI